jgi:aryl-alcohol dehydrogenase-like predicted oxidoreductase
MIHWDNRAEKEPVEATLSAFAQLKKMYQIRPGLSGIKHPEHYANAKIAENLDFDIQLKHNVIQSDLEKYTKVFDSNRHHFFAYGINAGGLKLQGEAYAARSTYLARGGNLETSSIRMTELNNLLSAYNIAHPDKAIRNFFQLGMIYAAGNTVLHVMLIGASDWSQLQQSLDYWSFIQHNDFSDIFNVL